MSTPKSIRTLAILCLVFCCHCESKAPQTIENEAEKEEKEPEEVVEEEPEPEPEPVEEVICNFARIEVKEPEIINQASQKLILKHGLSHLGREKHTTGCVCNLSQSHLEKEERMKRKKGTSGRGDQGVMVYGACIKKKTGT